MANSKEMVEDNSLVSPDFIQELLPSAERTALLYHLAFLSLGGFPKFERMIREHATETQMLFGSSEAVLMKCVGTSSNLVTSLFPILRKAVERNKPVLAIIYLTKAEEWIKDIVTMVDKIANRYDVHSKSVNKCTSDVYEEQDETKKKTDEMRGLEDALAKLKQELEKQVNKIETNEKQIKETNEKLNAFLRRFRVIRKHSIIKNVIVHFRRYSAPVKNPTFIVLDRRLKYFNSEKIVLRNEEWNIKIKQTVLQLQLANCKIRMGEIPDPVHLTEVQTHLTQIHQILLQLKKFWENVNVILSSLKDKTSVGKELLQMEDMEDLKNEFLDSIEDAGKYWARFGVICQRAHGVFRVQSKDAYKFLEINPSSLSEKEKKSQCESIMKKLQHINYQCSLPAAITE